MNDREKLIALIREGNGGYDFASVERIADHLISNGVTIQRWIPVDERLPGDEGAVLVCGSRGGIYTAEFRMFGYFGEVYRQWHKLNSKNHRCEPTHWMPLPQPPKEVE